jgi:hypothetical protein
MLCVPYKKRVVAVAMVPKLNTFHNCEMAIRGSVFVSDFSTASNDSSDRRKVAAPAPHPVKPKVGAPAPRPEGHKIGAPVHDRAIGQNRIGAPDRWVS